MADNNNDPLALAQRAAQALTAATGVARFDIALTLGSGWGQAALLLGTKIAEVSADQIPGFTLSQVIGHSGELSALEIPDGRKILIIGARTHLYEGREIDATVHSVRTAHAAGARTIVLTNGAGGVNFDYGVGEAVLIKDHINLTARSPLKGANFVDLTDLYSAELRAIAKQVHPELKEGVYAQVPGPHFETPAEIKYLRAIGADAVGMSTAVEAIAARALGMKVLGLTLITNPAAGVTNDPLDHEAIIAKGKSAAARLADLLATVVHKLP
ncbi:purine-nucleoside phosphorylase [Canibacter sp. lx-45]|uniref:purine-nucleoside phosphorylase n=1 Tax=Canibacter zhuwentaonis TaxID=2837491 RepID=UPI001BDCD35D|nr:purine-nucleoside phosphorylase [Canibacter zhuwentaonis]MBT1035803.1 purine-nucleoside phosphorylase [Canibacter zhuwentaonis]